MRTYKIAYLIDGLSMGGAERLMIPILKHLSRTDFDPYVCAMQAREGNPLADEIRAIGVPVECLNIQHLRDLDALPRVRRYLKSVGADLVHTQLEMANILGNISAKLLRLPGVCTIHVLPSFDVKTRRKLHQNVEWFSLRHFCDRVIAVSEETRQHHLRVSGAAPQQVTTIYNGIDLSGFAGLDRVQERVAIRAEFGIPADADVLVTVAVLRPPKGIQFMIQALPAVLAARPDTYYLVAGDGQHRSSLVDEIDRAGVRDRVILAGMRNDVPRLLAASDVFVLPTLTEALPTVLAEAMAARLPIIASRVGGIPEMIEDGRNGCLVRPGDAGELASACIHLLVDWEKRSSLCAEGWRVVHDQFNVERQVDLLKDLYLELLQAYGKS
jgi:glycosyltransferase involved in cell wall biosynthesis